MSEKQISSVQAAILSVVAAAVTLGLIDTDVSQAVTGVVVAVFVALGAFLVKRPRDHE